MREFLLVGAGGFVGSVLRHAVMLAMGRTSLARAFPLGTLVVNVVGCLALGLVLGVADARGALASPARAFVIVGLLGGFTTFSALGGETFHLLREGAWTTAVLSAALQLVSGLGAVALGWGLARHA
jgi:CrcB protein